MDQSKVGKFIAKMRKRQGMTQRELAEVLNISDKTVSKWECGNGMPEPSLMLEVSGVLEVTLNELFSGELLSDSDYKNKAEENMMELVREAEELRKNIVGGKVLGEAAGVDFDAGSAHKANVEFWDTIGSEVLGVTALPGWGGFMPDEDKLGVLGDLAGKCVLEIGCGSGRSLEYAAGRGAAGLWGLDISRNQIGKTKEYLGGKGICANLVCSPMEEKCGLPEEFFDVVFSVYGIGWSTDLDRTFRNIFSYLKRGGVFAFGWSHPIHKCVAIEDGRLIFRNSYFNEEWYRADMDDKEVMLSNRMLGTYINALAGAGFLIERLVEETDRDKAVEAGTDFGRKALMLPTVFVIRAVKP